MSPGTHPTKVRLPYSNCNPLAPKDVERVICVE